MDMVTSGDPYFSPMKSKSVVVPNITGAISNVLDREKRNPFSSDTPALDQSDYLAQSKARTSSFNKFFEEEEPSRLRGIPLGTNLLVRRNPVAKTGLVQSAAESVSDEVTVISIGENVHTIAADDQGVLRRFAGVGTEIKFEGEEYLIVDLTDILLRIPR